MRPRMLTSYFDKFKEIPLDQWGNSYRYEWPTNKGDGTKPAIWSPGPDGVDGTDDDIISWDPNDRPNNGNWNNNGNNGGWGNNNGNNGGWGNNNGNNGGGFNGGGNDFNNGGGFNGGNGGENTGGNGGGNG